MNNIEELSDEEYAQYIREVKYIAGVVEDE